MARSRNAFTLVELLVVISLMAVLATLTIAFFPSATTSAREARAATMLQSWLNIAKQRALRDQTPTGVRLLLDPAALPAKKVIECQYIAQPEDYCVGKLISSTVAGDGLDMVVFAGSGVDLVNGYTITPGDLKYWAVQPGDYLEVNGIGLVYRVKQVLSSTKVQVEPALPYKISTQCSYRIIRSPRVAGDETLKLPDKMMIDIDTNFPPNPVPNQLPISAANEIDILFAPSGAVISRGIATEKIHLWVRSSEFTDAFAGDPTLVSVFVRTGFIGAYSPDKSSSNPYILVK